MKEINTTIYKCIYCNKIYQLKRFAEKHHLRCRKNPKNIGCCNFCVHIDKKKFEVECSARGREYEEERSSLYCSKQDIYLKPRWSSGNIEGYFCDSPTIEKMPLKCDKMENCWV